MLHGLRMVLVRTKFPENVGAVARACANMGCTELVLVAPQRWSLEAALPMATAQGAKVLETLRVVETLAEALADVHTVYGTTARTGGWRKGVQTPAQAAPQIGEHLGQGLAVAVVFGPEDRGLTNEEIPLCGRLLRIPTTESASLNLAQAALIILYECFQHAPKARPFRPAGPHDARVITQAEQQTLYATLERTLTAMDFLKGENPDYWMLPVQRFLQRSPLRRNEFNLLMGVCRQAQWLARQAGQGGESAALSAEAEVPGLEGSGPA